MKKTTLGVVSTFLALASYSQSVPTWAEKNANLPSSPQRGILELVAKDQYSVWGISYYAGDLLGANDEFVRSTDGGNSWQSVPSPYQGLYVNGVAAVDSGTAYFAITDYAGDTSNDNHIVKTTDGGQNWSESFTPPGSTIPTHVHFFNANEGIVICDPVDDYWAIYRTSDAGLNWTRVLSDSIHYRPVAGEFGATFIFDAVGDRFWFLTGKDAGVPSKVLYSRDKGLSWYAGDDLNLPDTIHTAALTFRNDHRGLLRINDVLLRTNDAGITWSLVKVSSGTMFTFDMCNVPGTSMYISTGGDTGSDAHSLNGIGSSYSLDDGETWHTIDSAVSHTAVVFTSNMYGWSGGLNTDEGDSTGTTGGVFKAVYPSTGLTGNKTVLPKELHLTVYPNPAHDVLHLRYDKLQDVKDMTYVIADLAGKTVDSGLAPANGQLSISDLKPGVYFLNMNGVNAQSVKIIKQ